MNAPAVQIHGLCKSFGPVQAVREVSLAVYPGEILALVGPSGCGKTTLLRLLAGFEPPDAGQILLQDRPVAGNGASVPPEQRGIGMVFQDYALFPHLTAAENVTFGLPRLSRAQQAETAADWLERVGLAGYGGRYPHELSGGERQRVALARALAPRPLLLLMDEPFSNLDADRRAAVREEVKGLLRRLGTTVVFVTHDQEEALLMGDRLAVLNAGRLEQVGGPGEVFQHPATRFVADFLGQTDFIAGEVTPAGIETEAGCLSQRLDLPPGTPVEVAVRADDVEMGAAPGIPAEIVAHEYKGMYAVYRLRLSSGQILHSLQPHTQAYPPGARVSVRLAPGHPLACYQDGKYLG